MIIHSIGGWCETCQWWWPGRFVIGFQDPDGPADGPFAGIRPPTAEEEEEYALWCPECGERLEPRARPYYRSEDNHR